MKDALIKEIKSDFTVKLATPTNKNDEAYNENYESRFNSVLDKEVKALEDNTNMEKYIHKKIQTLPVRINELVEKRSSIKDPSKKASLNAEIDVLNQLNVRFIDESSKLAH